METKYVGSGSSTRKYKRFIPLMFLITLVFVRPVHAQGVGAINLTAGDALLSLQVENIKTHRRLSFVVGQTIHYKLRSSGKFKKGLITWIAEDTVSLQNKRKNIMIPVKSLVAFKVRRSAGRTAGGASLLTVGTMTLIPAAMLVMIPADESDAYLGLHVLGVLLGMVGLVEIGVGSELLSGKEIDLEKTWKLSAIKNKIN